VRLVAGVDSSTQSVKVTIRDADTGEEVRAGRASHPDRTQVDPRVWWDALQSALADAGGLDGVAALAVGAQQHGMVALDAAGEPVFDASCGTTPARPPMPKPWCANGASSGGPSTPAPCPWRLSR
jgi:xylulokinase